MDCDPPALASRGGVRISVKYCEADAGFAETLCEGCTDYAGADLEVLVGWVETGQGGWYD